MLTDARLPVAASPLPAQETWVFTFGFGHTHPETGESLSRCYVVVPGDINESRRTMERHFGRMWAFQYPTEEVAGVERYRLRRLELGGQRCAVETLGPDDLIRPCVLAKGHQGFCDTGR